MTTYLWKEGDMCFSEFKLSKIKRLEEKFFDTTDGHGILGSGIYRLEEIFPVNLEIKCISELYAFEADKINSCGLPGLNYPGIHEWLVAHWVRTCSKANDTVWIETRYNELRVFVEEILDKGNEIRSFRLKSGIHLMRQ